MATAEETELTDIQAPFRTCVVRLEAVDDEQVPENKTEDPDKEEVNDELTWGALIVQFLGVQWENLVKKLMNTIYEVTVKARMTTNH